MGGVFACIPNGTSLSRSLIQEQTGGKTQIASVISAFLIMCIILWIGPIFEVLPRVSVSFGIEPCVLSSKSFRLVCVVRYHCSCPEGHVYASSRAETLSSRRKA